MPYPHNLKFGSESLYIKVNHCKKFYHVTNPFSPIFPITSFLGKKPKFWSILQQERIGNIKNPEDMLNSILLSFKWCKQNSKIPNIT